MNITLDLSPEATRNAETTVPAPRLTWKRTGECQYETKIGGQRYLLSKTRNEWFVHKRNTEAVQRKANRPEWELVKPHSYIFDFGTSLKAAKYNAALFLVRGIDGDSPLWQD